MNTERNTLTRGEALDAIDACSATRDPLRELQDLSTLWIGHPNKGLKVYELVELLESYVAECCLSDDTRSNGNSNDDDTGIPS